MGEQEPWMQDGRPPGRPTREPEHDRTPASSSAQSPSRDGGDVDTLIVLELSGDGVLSVPLEQRRIGPLSLAVEPILVGRRHQPELHRNAITKECLQFLSRDHFRIETRGNGKYQITAMTNNPIWLAGRLMDEPFELKKDESMPVGFGDRVALGTGNSQTTAEEALQRLSWVFKRASGHEEVPRTEHANAAPEDGGGFLSAGLASFKAAFASATDRKEQHSPRLEPRSPVPGSRGRENPWDSDAGGSQWEPMLPPAAAVFNSGNRPRNDRPSEIFGPEPRLHSESHGSGSGVMRPPVFAGIDEEPIYGAIDVTKREEHDAFSKSGFSFH